MSNRETRPARHREEEADDRRRPLRRKKDNTPLIIGSVFVVAVLAIGGAGYLNRDRAAKAAPSAGDVPEDPYAASPFADIPPEEGPKRMSPGGGPARKITSNSPAGLLAEPIWTGAFAKATAAFALSDEAEAAKASGDNETFLAKAVQAKKQMDVAIIETADWELDLQAKYGDDDSQVRKIGRERDKWFKLLRKYHGLSKD